MGMAELATEGAAELAVAAQPADGTSAEDASTRVIDEGIPLLLSGLASPGYPPCAPAGDETEGCARCPPDYAQRLREALPDFAVWHNDGDVLAHMPDGAELQAR